ncbi:MAG: enoyl-CoA hydratase-related protein [Solirubrobacterales bacterium]
MTEPSQTFEKIKYGVADHVATITLDDPDTRNALSDQMLSEILSALKLAKDDYAVRVVVLASSNEKVFSAGGNLAAFGGDSGTVEKFTGASLFTDAFKALGELGKPSICAAQGHVLAGSLGLALACDLILASNKATFGTPEITVGLFPFMIMALIYRNVGRKKTNELLLLGERISADEAREAGIVNKVVRPELFDDNLNAWTSQLAAKSPLIMRLGKDAMWRQMDMPLVEALDYLRSQLAIELSTEDAIEGVKAFFEKREPEWKGR